MTWVYIIMEKTLQLTQFLFDHYIRHSTDWATKEAHEIITKITIGWGDTNVRHMMVFCSEHPKRDWNPNITPVLKQMTSTPATSICTPPPPPPGVGKAARTKISRICLQNGSIQPIVFSTQVTRSHVGLKRQTLNKLFKFNFENNILLLVHGCGFFALLIDVKWKKLEWFVTFKTVNVFVHNSNCKFENCFMCF